MFEQFSRQIGVPLLCLVTIAVAAGAATLDEFQAAMARKDYASLPGLAHSALEAGDEVLANDIARTYKREYLDGLSDAQFFDKEKTLAFVREFAFLFIEEGSSGRVFKFCYLHPKEADAFLDYSFSANGYVRWIITKEEIEDKLRKDGKAVTPNPDWQALHAVIAKRYPGDYADAVIEPAQVKFYKKDGNWVKWAELIDQRIKANPPKASNKMGIGGDGPWELNAYAWDAFLHSTNPTALRSALRWVENSITLASGANEATDQYLDTKAQLLYRLGMRGEAIVTERSAFDEVERRAGSGTGKGYQATLIQMNRGEPTWPAK